MIGIIPLMGLGQRFKDAGFTTPKHLLEIAPGITIIEKIISSFNGEPVYIGCRPEYSEEIIKIVKAGEYNAYVYSFDDEVLLPIPTVSRILEHIYCNFQPIVVHYADVFLPDGFGKLNELENYFPAAYIEVDTDDERFTRTKSGKGMGGIYRFQNKNEFITRIKANPSAKTMGEIAMIDPSWILGLTQIDIGTPEAYKEYQEAQNGKED